MLNWQYTYSTFLYTTEDDGSQVPVPVEGLEPTIFRMIVVDTGKVIYQATLTNDDITAPGVISHTIPNFSYDIGFNDLRYEFHLLLYGKNAISRGYINCNPYKKPQTDRNRSR